ncbi:MAG: hypothetical protein ACR2H7_06480 [Actinomycetota bacterium]
MSSARIPGSSAYEMSRVLDGLAGDIVVVHDQDIGRRGAHIDHIVVGSFGVLCLTARAQRGHVMVTDKDCFVAGQGLGLFSRARRDAATVAVRLQSATGLACFARAVVVMVGAQLTVQAQPDGVTVVTGEALPLWLRSLPQALDEVQQRAFSLALGNAATWVQKSRVPRVRPTPPAPAVGPARTPVRASARDWALFETWAISGEHRFYVHDPDGKCLAFYDVVSGELVLVNDAVRNFAEAMLGPHMKKSPRVRTDSSITSRSRRV